MLDFFLRMRPCDDRELRIDGASLLDHLSALETIRDRDEQAARCRIVRSARKLRIGGVPRDRLDARLAQALDDVLVCFEHQQRHARALERSADDAPHAAIADQHDMIG